MLLTRRNIAGAIKKLGDGQEFDGVKGEVPSFRLINIEEY